MPFIVDTYECFGCGGDVPRCRVVIPHTDDKLPRHLKGQDKFRKRVCICDNHPDKMTDWQKVEDSKEDALAGKE